jgi:tryptophanyl-tRNA synthetase
MAELLGDPRYLREVLRRGNDRARAIAEQTLGEVRALMRTAC